MALRNVILKILFFTIFLFNFNAASAQYYFDSTYIKKYYNNAVWSLYQNYNNHSLYISQEIIKNETFESKVFNFNLASEKINEHIIRRYRFAR